MHNVERNLPKIDRNIPNEPETPKTPPSTCKEKLVGFFNDHKIAIRIVAIALIALSLIALVFGINSLSIAVSAVSFILGATSLSISAVVKRSLPPPLPPSTSTSPTATPNTPANPLTPTPDPIPPVETPTVPNLPVTPTPINNAPPAPAPVLPPVAPPSVAVTNPPATPVTPPAAVPLLPPAPSSPVINYRISIQLRGVGNIQLDLTSQMTLENLFARLKEICREGGYTLPADCTFELFVNRQPFNRSSSLATTLENPSNEYALTPMIANSHQVRVHPDHSAICQALYNRIGIPAPVAPTAPVEPVLPVVPAPRTHKLEIKLVPSGKIKVEVPEDFSVDNFYQLLQRKIQEGGYTIESPSDNYKLKLLINGKTYDDPKMLKRVGSNYSLCLTNPLHPQRNNIWNALQSALPANVIVPPAPAPVAPRPAVTIIPPVSVIAPAAPPAPLPKGSFQIQCEDESLILSWATTTTVKNLISYLKDSAQLGGYRSDFGVELRRNNVVMGPHDLLKAKTGNLVDNCVLKISHPSYKEILKAMRTGMKVIKKVVLAADHWSSYVQMGANAENPHRNITVCILRNNQQELKQFSYIHPEATIEHLKAMLVDHQRKIPLFIEDGRRLAGAFFHEGNRIILATTNLRDLRQKQIIYANFQSVDLPPPVRPEDLVQEQRINPNFMQVNAAGQIPVDPGFNPPPAKEYEPYVIFNHETQQSSVYDPAEAQRNYLEERTVIVQAKQKIYLRELNEQILAFKEKQQKLSRETKIETLSQKELIEFQNNEKILKSINAIQEILVDVNTLLNTDPAILEALEVNIPASVSYHISLLERVLDGSLKVSAAEAPATPAPTR